MNEQERNAKIDYLKSYRWIEAEIMDDEERLARLDARLYSPGAVKISDMPRGGQPITMETLVAEKIELQDRINAKNARRRAILESIERMPSERDRRILKLRFVDGMTHEEVAERINYSTMQARRYCDAALERFDMLNINDR
ncbi:MAG: sigma-70 family RNA polymerase sigma factor [Kiritimatiellae bacterium]|nr:sigma-70 family RNA polymerase sigma factor [Kiritimatiellia bacterium]